ncbi:MAG: S-methyl-5-thioribose-1-phosphate isomerase, partial [Myxococcota bacterium]|nr:S-methyl-5-thioribose-1-phosphate isomerase [Myxococcota bacterium]
VGTYPLAVLAREHGIPFYVAAPLSSIDLATPDGEAIPIEERSPDEVLRWAGTLLAPEGASARHPAFDVTPARLVTAIVTERGIARSPYFESLAALGS